MEPISSLSEKFWQNQSNIKNGYLEKKDDETKKESPTFMEILNGVMIGLKPMD